MGRTFYFTGQRTFSNRGCEAIVRSTVDILTQSFGESRFLVPSDDPGLDARQWPEARERGVEFVGSGAQPRLQRAWQEVLARFPGAQSLPWPFPISREVTAAIDSSDAVISVGGDMYSLDYRFPIRVMSHDSAAMNKGKPTFLWGASVGPFSKTPAFEPTAFRHLARMQNLFIRDELTAKYLQDHGLKNVTRVSDPAFVLKPATSVEIDLPPGSRVLGLNISPLVEADRAAQGRESLVEVAQAYVKTILRETDFGVVLIPHVFPLSGGGVNDDRKVLRAVHQAFKDEDRVRLVDAQLNASQLKAIIAACHLFVGARTHATIAAMSSGRPTISLSYSVKARGINRDAFGHEDLVLDARKVTADELWRLTAHMASQEQELGQVLVARLPGLRERAQSAGSRVAEALGARR